MKNESVFAPLFVCALIQFLIWLLNCTLYWYGASETPYYFIKELLTPVLIKVITILYQCAVRYKTIYTILPLTGVYRGAA